MFKRLTLLLTNRKVEVVESGQVLDLKTGSKEDSQLLKEGLEMVVSISIPLLSLILDEWLQ